MVKLLLIFTLATSTLSFGGEHVEVEKQIRKLQISKIEDPYTLDEFIAYGRDNWTSVHDFRQYEPNDGAVSSELTEAYIAYDAKNIYIGFICYDKSGDVRALLSKREDIGQDDTVSVYLDTFLDRRRAYVFSTNPLGIQKDSVITEGQGEDERFDTVWNSEGKLISGGYSVLFTIPFRSLRFSSKSIQTWGIAFSRFIVHNQEKVYWPYITRRVEGIIQQMAELEGLEDISPEYNFQFTPYGTFTAARLLERDPVSFQTQNDWRSGLDAKFVLQNALTLDATVNPDFSQVESDDPQVTVNQRYEVYFPEKRPFFIENAGYFETPIELFFSRRIVDPEFGTRLTGKIGSWSVGMIASDDRAPGSQLEGDQSFLSRRAGIGVGRLQREFRNQSSIGILGTYRGFMSESNGVISLDTRLRLNPNWFVTGQIATSTTRDSEGAQKTGSALLARLSHAGEHFSYSGSYTDFSPGFNTDLGFVKRVDERKMTHNSGYFWYPKNNTILSFGPSISGTVNWDRANQVQDWNVYANFSIDLKGPIGFEFSRYEAYTLYLGHEFRYHRTDGSFYVYPWQMLSLYGSYGLGTDVNYSPASGLVPFKAKSMDGYFGITFKPTSHLRSENIYYFTQLSSSYNDWILAQYGDDRIFVNHLVRWKLNYQFTHRLSLRFIVDYYSMSPNTLLIEEWPYRQLKGDVLLTYLVNPSTALYVGYADRYDSLELLHTDPPTIESTSSPSLSTARQFFVKLSYLFRL